MGAYEAAHILYKAEYGHAGALEHTKAFSGIDTRNVLRGGYEDGSIQVQFTA
jgi:hypothetical protein